MDGEDSSLCTGMNADARGGERGEEEGRVFFLFFSSSLSFLLLLKKNKSKTKRERERISLGCGRRGVRRVFESSSPLTENIWV